MSKLAALKKNKGANLKKLQEKLESQSNSGPPKDERIWKPKLQTGKDKGTAVVRFLTPKEGDPFVQLMQYQFKDKGGNFWDNALQTIGEKDPVQLAAINAFRKAKADGDQSLREYAKKFMPRRSYYANVLVIKDESEPENEGKVKIFKFGPMIFSFIEKASMPEFDDMEAFDPFDYWDGADFKIRMVKDTMPGSDGKTIEVPTYKDSAFDKSSALFDGDDEKIDEIYQQTYDLSEFVSSDKFKSFDEVAEQFKKVTGKPWNWLSSEGVQDHIEETQEKENLEKTVDHGDYVSNDDDDDSTEEIQSQVDMDSDSKEGDKPEQEESAIERFKRLAKQSKK